MAQNRNKLIELLIGNSANAVVHQILEKAVGDENLAQRYNKELTTSLGIAKKYRGKINPKIGAMPEKDGEYIKSKIEKRVRAELSLRIAKGYQNIHEELIEEYIATMLKKLQVI